jgi:hypothetical protein
MYCWCGGLLLNLTSNKKICWGRFFSQSSSWAVPDPEPCPDPCPTVGIKVKVHPCLDLNFAGSRQKKRPLDKLETVRYKEPVSVWKRYFLLVIMCQGCSWESVGENTEWRLFCKVCVKKHGKWFLSITRCVFVVRFYVRQTVWHRGIRHWWACLCDKQFVGHENTHRKRTVLSTLYELYDFYFYRSSWKMVKSTNSLCFHFITYQTTNSVF